MIFKHKKKEKNKIGSKEKPTQKKSIKEPLSAPPKPKETNVGKVFRAETKYIDKDTKPKRDVVVLVDNGNLSVAKLKSIKTIDDNGKNTDRALVEINSSRYGLKKRTGVDFQAFDKNRISGKPLKIEDKKVFPEQKERFKLGSHDLHKVLIHTGRGKKPKKKR